MLHHISLAKDLRMGRPDTRLSRGPESRDETTITRVRGLLAARVCKVVRGLMVKERSSRRIGGGVLFVRAGQLSGEEAAAKVDIG